MDRGASGTGPASAQEDDDAEDSFEFSLRKVARLRDSEIDGIELPSSGEVVGGKYRVNELLATGGMGAVFRATHIVSGKAVALKWLLPSADRAAARFLREARAAARIDHPNVVDVYDLGSHRGGHYLVMELLRGRSLGARLRAGRMEPTELVAIMIPLLRGVAAAHAHGVVHRDLKPDNVFLSEAPDGTRREPKVLDFGISKLRVSQAETERLTGSGAAMGTPAYMSPEQLLDARNVDERTDIYAAGVIMYEALSGRLPFAGEGRGAFALLQAAASPLPLRSFQPSVPLALERVVLKAMARAADDRHRSVEALIEELAPFLPAPAPAPVRVGREAQAATWPRRPAVALLGLVAILVVLAQAHGLRDSASATSLASAAAASPGESLRSARAAESLKPTRADSASAPRKATRQSVCALPAVVDSPPHETVGCDPSEEPAPAASRTGSASGPAGAAGAVDTRTNHPRPHDPASPPRRAERRSIAQPLRPRVAPRAGRIDLTDL